MLIKTVLTLYTLETEIEQSSKHLTNRDLTNQDHQGLRRQMCKVCLRSRAKCEIISHLVIFLRFLFRY